MTFTPPTFVLVPGAWQGGWAWQPVARRLREAGYPAVTITLPGLADGDERAGLRLSDAIDHVVAEVNRRDLSEDDRALARPGTEFAARIGLTPMMVPGGHESMLTRPDEVTTALLKI